MNDAVLTYQLDQNVTRETRRMQLEREHPDGLSQYEIREAIGATPTLRIYVQMIISNIRKTNRPAPSRRAYSEPITSCSPQV